MRIEERVFVFGPRLLLAPVAHEDVLASVDQPLCVCDGLLVERVGSRRDMNLQNRPAATVAGAMRESLVTFERPSSRADELQPSAASGDITKKEDAR